jgi:maleate isomerase
MSKPRIGMIVPSLNTIAEDDFRAFCPDDVAYHVHRVRLRKENGRVTMDALVRSHLEALDDASYLADLSPQAIGFNCTGASVAYGPGADETLAKRMTEKLGIPSSNTMVAIKLALRALRATRVLHVCPFTDEFSRIERDSLTAAGIDLAQTISLEFTDAKKAALMQPSEIVAFARERFERSHKAVLLSCANVRAFEAAAQLEKQLGVPVVTSNQAMLWALLELIGWRGELSRGGSLFGARAS